MCLCVCHFLVTGIVNSIVIGYYRGRLISSNIALWSVFVWVCIYMYIAMYIHTYIYCVQYTPKPYFNYQGRSYDVVKTTQACALHHTLPASPITERMKTIPMASVHGLGFRVRS